MARCPEKVDSLWRLRGLLPLDGPDPCEQREPDPAPVRLIRDHELVAVGRDARILHAGSREVIGEPRSRRP